MRNKSPYKNGIYYAPWEERFNRILTPFEEFIERQTTSGILLIIMTFVALFLANSAYFELYYYLKLMPVSINIGSWGIEKNIHHWVNDGLMAIFFFVIGLELKREILVGELSDMRKATLPIAAAIGGMVAPALIYYYFNPDSIATRGWGIPMATDIAFALAVLSLLSNRIPRELTTFLIALAIVDDLGAIIVIAVFYTETIALDALAITFGLFGLLLFLNIIGIRKITPYLIVVSFLWYALMKSGVHATLAGVLGAFSVPALPKYNPEYFSGRTTHLIDKFKLSYKKNKNIMKNAELRAIVHTLENHAQNTQTLLQRLEKIWHLPVAYLIIPIFILFNAGIPIEIESFGKVFTNPVALGVSSGLIIGKFIGIAGVSWVFLKLGLARLPSNVRFTHIAGVSLIAGIGFTMSIFVAELAFDGQKELLIISKTGIIFSSLVAGILGAAWLLMIPKEKL